MIWAAMSPLQRTLDHVLGALVIVGLFVLLPSVLNPWHLGSKARDPVPVRGTVYSIYVG